MKKLRNIFAITLCMLITLPITVINVFATGEAFFYVPKNPVMIGQEFAVSITFSADSNIGSVQATLTYDDSAVEFVSGDNASGGGGVLTVNGFPEEMSAEVTFEFSFRALAQGEAAFELTNCAVYSPESDLIGSPTAYAKVTVGGDKVETTTEVTTTSKPEETTENTKKPSDGIPDKGVLTALTVDKGELTPAFAYNVYDYKVYVDNSVDNVEIEGTTASLSDYIWYTGTSECAVGENVRTITVTDVDGNETTYTVTIIRAADGETVQTETKDEESKIKKPDSSSLGSSKNEDPMDPYKKLLNPALAIVLVVLVIALFVVIIWIKGKVKGGKS